MIDEKLEKEIKDALDWIEIDVLEIYDELEGEGVYSEYIENKVGDILKMIGEIRQKLNIN